MIYIPANPEIYEIGTNGSKISKNKGIPEFPMIHYYTQIFAKIGTFSMYGKIPLSLSLLPQGIIFMVSHRNLLCIFDMTSIQNIFCVP